MKIDTLSFLNLLLTSHSPSVFHSHVDTLVKVYINILLAVKINGVYRWFTEIILSHSDK